MPISSNYQVQTSALEKSQVGALPKPAPEGPGFNWWGFARIATTIASLALTMIPGIGWGASTAIAVGSAGAFTGIDAATGNLTATNMAITWSSAIIPTFSQIAKGTMAASKIAQSVGEAEQAVIVANEAAQTAEGSGAIFAGFAAKVEAQGRLTELKNIQSQVSIWSNPHDLRTLVEKSLDASKSAYQQDIEAANSFFSDLSAKAAESSGKPFDAMQYTEYAATNNLSQAQFDAIKTDFLELTGEHIDAAIIKFQQLQNSQQAIASGLVEQGQSLFQAAEEVLANNSGMIVAEAGEEIQDDVRNYGKTSAEILEIEEELRKIFGNERIDALLLSIRNAPKSQQQSRILDWIRQNMAREEAEALVLRLDNQLNKALRVGQRAPKGFIDKHIYALKHPFSSHFAENWVQKLQLVDPNDIGRAPVEFLYKVLRKRMAKFFERAAVLEKGLKRLEQMKEAFEKTGGTLVNSQRIIGYKVLHKVGLKTLIMISFNPMSAKLGGTGADHLMWNGVMTKNYKGKKPVFVEATDLQLEELITGGFSYYLDTWAYNHGGRPVGGKFFGMGGMLSGMTHLLPWINTTALRSWLSITSNWVENVADMVRGEYGSQWVHKFLRSMKRSGISRGGRLLAQGFIRPLIGGRAGFFIGKEMQRILGATSSGLANAMDKKRGTFGERFGKSFKSQLLPRGYQAAVSYTNRGARARGAYGAQVRGAQRKLTFLRRPISAVTPNSVLNPRGFLRIPT